MTQAKIFNILAKNNGDFPNLRADTTDTIVSTISTLIYDSIKSKSVQSSQNRLNIIRFLQIIGTQSQGTTAETLLELIKCRREVLEPDFQAEKVEEKRSLQKEIGEFFARKKRILHTKTVKLALIRKYDQEAFDQAKFPSTISRNASFYEYDPTMLEILFRNAEKADSSNKKQVTSKVNCLEYREAQIKLAYALCNLNETSLLESILMNLGRYPGLAPKEVNLLIYLSRTLHVSTIQCMLSARFSFIYEQVVLKMCKELISLGSDEGVDQFFWNVETNPEFVHLQKMCELNFGFNSKMKAMVFQLYSLSFCNENLLKFMDLLVKT